MYVAVNLYLSSKLRVISFFALMLVFLQHAINAVGYIAPTSVFHLPLTFNNVFQLFVGYGIAPVCIPLFFTISAYLMFHNYTRGRVVTKYRSRVKSLLIPYIAWNIVGILTLGLLQHLPIIGTYFLTFYTGDVWGKTVGSYLMTILTHGISFHLWFIFELIIYTLLTPIIYVAIRFAKHWLPIIIFCLWILGRSYNLYLVSWEHIGFYLLGAYFARYPQLFSSRISKTTLYMTLLLWASVLFVKTYVTLGYLPIIEPISVILHRVSLAFGFITIWYGYDHIATRLPLARLEYLSVYSFFVYAAHEPLLELLKKMLIDSRSFVYLSPFAIYLIAPGITMAICFTAAFLFKRWFKRLYPLLSGHR